MTAADVHALCNEAVLPGWLLLMVAPRWRWTHRITHGLVLTFGVIYVALFASQIGHIEGGYGSLAGVARLFGNPYVLAAAWTHFLAFDLFVGAWMTRDARDAGVPHLMVVPCLVLVFLAGPAGLLLYLAVRTLRRHSLRAREHHG